MKRTPIEAVAELERLARRRQNRPTLLAAAIARASWHLGANDGPRGIMVKVTFRTFEENERLRAAALTGPHTGGAL